MATEGGREDIETVPSIAIIILAAGPSRRMGVPKQLLRHRGRTLIRHAVEAALGSICRPIVVVLGASAGEIRPELEGLPARIAENPHWPDGLSTSIRAGIDALSSTEPSLEAVVLTLCDQPFVSSDDIDGLVAAYRSSEHPIVASQYAGTVGVPALFARPIWPELTGLSGDAGAKKVIQKHLPTVRPVSCPHGAIDLDTPEDYDAIYPTDEGH